MLLTGIGDQLPEIPSLEVVGSGGMVAPLQYGPACVNVGVVFGVIVIDIDVVVTHVPPDGVKVYVPEAV